MHSFFFVLYIYAKNIKFCARTINIKFFFSTMFFFYVTAFNSRIAYVCIYIKQSSWKWTIAMRIACIFGVMHIFEDLTLPLLN